MLAPACVRQAWLTLGSLSVPLENPAAGYFCTSLDLGYPDVRDVVNNRPDQDGIDDRTMYMGGRTVTAEITALTGAGAQIDAVASSFAPFMTPSVRPVLHYILDRPGAAERTLTLRPSGYSWPVAGPFERDIQLQFVAADPIARDTVTKTATAWAGSSTPPGRTYPLAFNRIYPPGSSSPTTGLITVTGDVAARPLLRVYGPITSPYVAIYGTGVQFAVYFMLGYAIPAGQWVDVDTANKTAYLNSDPTQSAATAINWASSSWPVLTPGQWQLHLLGGSTTGISQVQAIWTEGYLS
jgi:hypothetical protein